MIIGFDKYLRFLDLGGVANNVLGVARIDIHHAQCLIAKAKYVKFMLLVQLTIINKDGR